MRLWSLLGGRRWQNKRENLDAKRRLCHMPRTPVATKNRLQRKGSTWNADARLTTRIYNLFIVHPYLLFPYCDHSGGHNFTFDHWSPENDFQFEGIDAVIVSLAIHLLLLFFPNTINCRARRGRVRRRRHLLHASVCTGNICMQIQIHIQKNKQQPRALFTQTRQD